MYKEILRSISNIELFPVIAIVIFFLFFIGLLIWVFGMDKKLVTHMSHMPLKEDEEPMALIGRNGKAEAEDIKLFSK